MKKIMLSILSIGVFTSVFSQTQQGGGPGFEFGVRGAAASNWMFNSNVSGGQTQSYSPAFSYNYGLHIAFNFSDKIAIETTPYMGIINQGYNGKFGSGEYIPYGPIGNPQPVFQPIVQNESYTSNNKVNITGIPLLLRAGSGNGAYVEIGPEYDIVNSATYTATFTNGPTVGSMNPNLTTTSYYASSNIMGVLGFGDDFQIGSSGLNIVTCLRFYYGFTDFIGADGLGQNLNSSNTAVYTGNYGGTGKPYYQTYNPTHVAGASFTIGAYYYIPVTTSKGGRTACKHPPRVRS